MSNTSSGIFGRKPARVPISRGLNSRVVRPVNQCRTEICPLPDELRRGPGVRVVAEAEHRKIDEMSRRGSLPDLGVNVQIDPLINPVPDPVFAGIGNFQPRDPLQARDHSSLGSLLEGIGVELSDSPSAGWLLGVWIPPRSLPCRPRWVSA